MIAERMRAACWVAAGLAVATCVAVALRSSSPTRASADDADRRWYREELARLKRGVSHADVTRCTVHTTNEEVLRLERELHDLDRRLKLLIDDVQMTRELFDEGMRRQRELDRNDMLLRPPAHASTNG